MGEQVHLYRGAGREYTHHGAGRRLNSRGRFAQVRAGDSLDLPADTETVLRQTLGRSFSFSLFYQMFAALICLAVASWILRCVRRKPISINGPLRPDTPRLGTNPQWPYEYST